MSAAEREPDVTARDNPDVRLLADQLRDLREGNGWSRDELGAMINHTGSTIANIETGYRAPTREQAAALDKAFNLNRFFRRLQARIHSNPFSAGFRDFASHEREATTIRIFENMVVPGLLQIADYAEPILSVHPDATPALVAERLEGRLGRQAILDREAPKPPRLWVVLDEGVLHREIGSKKVMREQIERLIELAALPNITIQVLTEQTHCSLNGAFYIAQAPDATVGYIETAIDGTTVEDEDVVADLEVKFDVLRTEALRGRESVAMLERTVEEWTD